MPPEALRARPAETSPPPALSWWLLAAAFSPVLLDLLAHVAHRPWAGYCVVFLPLFVLELRRAPLATPRPRSGWALLALALAAELLLVAGGLTRAARPALALAAFGLGRILGRPDARTAALLLWFVPVPSEGVSLASPIVEGRLGELAAGLLQLLGQPAWLEWKRGEAVLHVAHGSLALVESDGALPPAALASGLAWLAGLRRGASLAATLAAAFACACLAVPVQVAALAGAAHWVGAGGAARPALDVAPWLVVALVGLPFALRAGRDGAGVRRGRDGAPARPD